MGVNSIQNHINKLASETRKTHTHTHLSIIQIVWQRKHDLSQCQAIVFNKTSIIFGTSIDTRRYSICFNSFLKVAINISIY